VLSRLERVNKLPTSLIIHARDAQIVTKKGPWHPYNIAKSQ